MPIHRLPALSVSYGQQPRSERYRSCQALREWVFCFKIVHSAAAFSTAIAGEGEQPYLGGPNGAEHKMTKAPSEAVSSAVIFKGPVEPKNHRLPSRCPKVRSVQLTARDLLIFQFLQAKGAKTSADLSNQFWDGHSKKAKAGFQRIRLLIRFGFLERGNPRLLYLSESAKQILPTALGVEDKKPQ